MTVPSLHKTIVSNASAVMHMKHGDAFAVNCYRYADGDTRYSRPHASLARNLQGADFESYRGGFQPSYVVRVWPKVKT